MMLHKVSFRGREVHDQAVTGGDDEARQGSAGFSGERYPEGERVAHLLTQDSIA